MEEARVAARQNGVQDVEQRPGGDDRRDHERRAPPEATSRREHGDDDCDERGWEVHGRASRGEVERVAQRDLPHGGDRHARLQVREEADA
jgi:hypothetical protein